MITVDNAVAMVCSSADVGRSKHSGQSKDCDEPDSAAGVSGGRCPLAESEVAQERQAASVQSTSSTVECRSSDTDRTR